jgi:16S rRNA (adenine1518-N6/adenine1519-N6)-dimethyltransferase
MLQKEVVDRMAAEPGSKVYGRLSVMLQLACRVEPLFNVPPEAFRPPPKVESSVVRLLPLPPEQLHDADPEHVYAVVKAAFAQRRKTLSNALKQLLDSDAIRSADVDPKARAETLAPADFVRLAKVYSAQSHE